MLRILFRGTRVQSPGAKTKVTGMYRGQHFPMPAVGDPLIVECQTNGAHFRGTVTAVDLARRTYDFEVDFSKQIVPEPGQ